MDPLTADQITCPFCSSTIDVASFFCPVCGKNIREKPLSTGIRTQIGLYAASVLLPPFFLWWTIKYLKSNDQQTKKIGMISLGLTAVAVVAAIWLSVNFTKSLTSQVNRQLNQYQDIGL